MKKLTFLFLFSFFSLYLFSESSFHVIDANALSHSHITIETDWDFYWGRFISPADKSEADLVVSVPSPWNSYDLPQEAKLAAKKGKGSGTYRLRLTGLIPGKKYAIPTFELGYTAFSLLADDVVIFRSGTPSENWEKTDAKQYYDKAVFEADKEGSVLLTMYVSNNFYRKGGFRHEFLLYEEPYYVKTYKKSLCNQSIFTGIMLTIIVYCFLLAFLKKDKTNLYLSLFVFFIYSRIVSSVFPMLKILFKNFPLEMLFRIEYLCLFMAPALYALYMDSMNKKIFHHIPVKIVAAPALIFLILDFSLPISIANRLVPLMQFYMFAMVGLLIVLFLIRVVKNKDFTSTSAILSLLVLMFGTMHDYFLKNLISLPFFKDVKLLLPCFVLYAFIQTVLMAYIQNKNQNRVIELNDNLTILNNAYYRFVPKELLELFGRKNIMEVKLGESKISKMAVLSADIRNFTSASEKMEGIRVFEMLNSYLAKVAPLIRENGGIIEKYLGDGIIAIFPDSAEAALRCAIQMQEEMIGLRQEFIEKGLPPIKIGIGVHYGNIVIGTGGDDERMTEISLSDDIDIAVRTEASTKDLLRPILATSQVVGIAAQEAKREGRKFDFCGRRLKDSKGNIVYALYTEKTGDVL